MIFSGDGKDAASGAAKSAEYFHEYEVYTNGPGCKFSADYLKSIELKLIFRNYF